MRRALLALVLWLGLAGPTAARPAPSAAALAPVDVRVESNGRYELRSHAPDFTFAGDVGRPVTNIRARDAVDAVGPFHEVQFDSADRTSGIRAYRDTSVVLFTTTYLARPQPAEPFPVLTSVPALPYKLSYRDIPFSPYQLNTLADAPDSPWLFFGADGSGFLISPAANFPVARMTFDGATLRSGLDAGVAEVPAGFTQQTVLVTGTGANATFEAWGAALTALRGKVRPANDADLTLEKFGYWTDNGAVYYYHFEPDLGYAGTLLEVKREFDRRGLPLGYLQLDSWWYPKGASMRWDDRDGGIYRYRAAADLFPGGLPAFQQQVGLPLVTHARWIDPASPYRSEFSFSGNVMTDARYWDDLMGYLQAGSVVTYEQDWLGAQAQPVYDLTAPKQFMDNMARAAAQRGMTLQYCMALPRHMLQTLEYPNVTTIRVSDDRFDRNRWDWFLYTSRLASALGVWPWADVFMSGERNNLLLATLSAGVVGIGDQLGAVNEANVRRVMRADAVLIKPDVPIVPTDESVLAEARAPGSPMVAFTYTDHGPLRQAYVFAYARGNEPQTTSFSPTRLGIAGPTLVYDVSAESGRVLNSDETFTTAASSGSYFLVAPIGPSGIAFLGDAGAFVSLGKKRISQLSDDGTLQATVEFAAGEQSVTLHGFAASAPAVSTAGGAAEEVGYDSQTRHFHVVVHPEATPGQVSVVLGLESADAP